MSLKDIIQKSVVSCMKEGDKNKLKVLRMLTASIKQKEIDERIILDETQIISVVEKMLKQRRDSLSQYLTANRQDLADIESFEIKILKQFMPVQLSTAELEQLILEVIKTVDANSIRDMGKIMNALKPKIQGKADMGQVSQIIKTKLSA